MKRTCFWLRGLPKLFYSKEDSFFWEKTFSEIPGPVYIDKSGKKRYFTDAVSGRDMSMRNRTFPRIARAMAEQWG